MFIVIDKGQHGQWKVTLEHNGVFETFQYYGYTKKEALKKAKLEYSD